MHIQIPKPISVPLLTLLCISVILAQTPTGSIRGTVSDQAGAVIANATVIVKNLSTNLERRVVTNDEGNYTVENLLPGEYEVKAEAQNFQSQVRRVTVQTGNPTSADFSLKVGVSTEVVEVASEAPQINTSDFKVDGVVTRAQIENLPLNGRSFLQLALLEPGVSVENVANPGTSPNNFFRVSIAGAGQALTRISVDGATVNDRVTGGTAQNFSQETVQEFQISSFSFDLSTSVTGVGSINIVSRTGGNSIHGTGFFYFRDNNMAANPGFARDLQNPEPFFARRQSGFNIGGPFKKDKLFWFVNYEHNNQDGVFNVTHNNHPIFSKFDHIADNPVNFDQLNTRVDWKVTDKNSAFLRYSLDMNDNFNPSGGVRMPSNWVVSDNYAYQVLGGLSTVFTPTVVNDLRYSFNYYSNHLDNLTTKECKDPARCIGLGGPDIRLTDNPFIIGNNVNTPQNRILRTYHLVDNLSLQKGNHRIRFGGEWEHFYGQGSWAFVEPAIIVLWGPVHIAQFAAAVPTIRPLLDSLPRSLKDPTAPPPTLEEILQLPLFQFFTGIGDPGQPPPFRSAHARRNDRIRVYAQDAWQVRQGFTFNYGIAYSYEDNLLNHDLDRPAYLSPLLGGDLRPPRHDPNNFGPSAGFAWDLGKNGKTVLRGGGGVYHDSNLFWTRLRERALTGPAGNGRASIEGSIVGRNFSSFPTNYRGANLLVELPAFRAALASRLGNGTDLSIRGIEVFKQGDQIFNPNSTTPYSMHVNFGVQRELARNLVLTADFVMRRSVHFGGHHDLFGLDMNRFNRPRVTGIRPDGTVDFVRDPVIPLCVGAQTQDPKAQCSTGAINIYQSSANFRYTGLHVKVDKRFSGRYQFTASYALSKYTGFNGVIDFNNWHASEGYQGADRRHRFTFSGIMELPTYSGESRFLRGFFNTWQVSLISQMVSKPPLNASVGGDVDGDGISTFLLPGVPFNGFGRSINKQELVALVDQYNKTFPTVVTGKRTPQNQVMPVITLPANFDNGDSFFSQDIRVTRIIKLGERYKLSIFGEAFNLFNIANLSGYSSALNNPSFGQPSSRVGQVFGTGGPRAFQIATRFSW